MRMIKGVNRQIIEVTETGNAYFERALLVVRPGFSDASPGRLHDEARRYVRGAEGYAGLKLARRRKRMQMALQGGTAGILGMILGALIMAAAR